MQIKHVFILTVSPPVTVLPNFGTAGTSAGPTVTSEHDLIACTIHDYAIKLALVGHAL